MTDENIDGLSQDGKGDVPCPRIVIFKQEFGPELSRPFIARFVVTETPPFGPNKGKPSLGCLPLVFWGRSAGEALEAAQTWWAEEQRKLRARNAALIKARQSKTGRGKTPLA